MTELNAAKRAQQAGDIARLLSYVLLLLASAALFVAARQIPVSRFERLGAGAFPTLVFGAIVFMSLLAIIDAARKIPRAAYADFAHQTRRWVRQRYLVFIVLAALGLYLVLIPLLGFSWASLLFVFGVQLILMPPSPKRLLLAMVIALLFSFGINALFAEVFNVFLPRGVL